MAKYLNLVLLVGCIQLVSCSYFKKNAGPADGTVVARVNNDYLYVSDVNHITRGLSGKDSVEAVKVYAQNWVRKKLLLQKATENISDEDVGVSKKVEEYRETLLLYEYEKALINQKLDTVVKSAELTAWYEKVKADFPAEEDLYLLFFIKLDKDAPDLAQARKWILKPKDEDELRQLAGYCKEVAISYTLDKGVWYGKENAVKNFPVSAAEIDALAGGGKFKEYKQDDALWFLRVVQKISKGQPTPPELLQEKIVRMVMEKRKMMLLEKIYNNIYEDGKEAKLFDIYTP